MFAADSYELLYVPQAVLTSLILNIPTEIMQLAILGIPAPCQERILGRLREVTSDYYRSHIVLRDELLEKKIITKEDIRSAMSQANELVARSSVTQSPTPVIDVSAPTMDDLFSLEDEELDRFLSQLPKDLLLFGFIEGPDRLFERVCARVAPEVGVRMRAYKTLKSMLYETGIFQPIQIMEYGGEISEKAQRFIEELNMK